MRSVVILAALALCACGEPQTANDTPEAPAAQTAGGFDLSGHLIVLGEGYRLDADPQQNATVLNFPEEELTIDGPYVLPEATATGAHVQAGDISLTLTPGACTFEGATYPMNAVVQFTNSRPLDGCAIVRWDRHLIELMPQIDACIAQSPTTRWISYAGDTGEALVTVRMQGEGAQVDCTVPNDAADHATIAPRREELRVAGENEAIFVRGPGANPGGECYDAPEVRGADGELLGWMMDPEGC